MTTKMQSCIDHIKTSTDVDPWAMEMVEQIFTEYDKRFDQVLEIIDRSTAYAKELDGTISDKADGMMAATNAIRKAVLALKGGERE